MHLTQSGSIAISRSVALRSALASLGTAMPVTKGSGVGAVAKKPVGGVQKQQEKPVGGEQKKPGGGVQKKPAGCGNKQQDDVQQNPVGGGGGIDGGLTPQASSSGGGLTPNPQVDVDFSRTTLQTKVWKGTWTGPKGGTWKLVGLQMSRDLRGDPESLQVTETWALTAPPPSQVPRVMAQQPRVMAQQPSQVPQED